MMKKLFVLCSVVLLVLGAVFTACGDSDDKQPEPATFSLLGTEVSPCKANSSSAVTRAAADYPHSLEYEAAANGMLRLKDVNCLVNCAIQGIDTDVTLVGSVITVNVQENTGDVVANCICPVDIEMTVGPLNDGDYTLTYCRNGKEAVRTGITYSSKLKGTCTIEDETAPEKAYDMEVDGILYLVNADAPQTVSVVRNEEKKYSGEVVIPSQVTYNGSTYQVTAIGPMAFYECNALTSVSIPSSVTSLGVLSFTACPALAKIYCRSNVPPTLYQDVFDATVLKNATLYVPAGCKDVYSTASKWKEFIHIEE